MTIWHHLGNFFYSNAFVGLVALGAATIAYRVYSKQKRDTKRDAANIVLLEIENAEQQSEKVSFDKPFTDINDEDVFLMPVASWDKYKYLFVRDFDRNEWDKITNFYRKCHSYDQSVVFHNASLDHNMKQLRVNVQRELAEYASEYASKYAGANETDKETVKQEYIRKRNNFTDLYTGSEKIDPIIFTYIPTKAFIDAKRALSNLETSLSLTSVGIKLKKLVDKNTIGGRIKNWLNSFKNLK
jgi:hypothetical protein